MKNFSVKMCLFLCFVILFSFGAQKSVTEFKGDENFYFESSRRMLETGDILTPRYMNEERFQKPILFYWFILFFFKIFGVNWIAARLASILFGALCAILIFEIAESLFRDKRAALLSALFAATTPLYYRYARLAVPDMPLIFFETLALYFFIRYYEAYTKKTALLSAENLGIGFNRVLRINAALFFASLAVAFLIKGPAGVVIPVLISGIFCLIRKEKVFRPTDVFIGITLFMLITVPWFYVMCKRYAGKYADQVILREILQRLGWGETRAIVMVYIKGFIFYAVKLVIKFLPYSLFMPFAFLVCARNKERRNYGNVFLAIWVSAVFLFFVFVAERRAHYLLALAPAVSIITGRFFAGLPEKRRWIPFGIAAFLSVMYIAANAFLPSSFFTNKMERAALSINAYVKEGDRIGIGSHGIIPEELQVFFKTPVELVKVTYTPEGEPSMDTAGRLTEFLTSKEKVFCVIKKEDYYIFVPAKVRENLVVIDSYFVWKRRMQFDKKFKEFLKSKNSGLFREIFQNEIYVVTNKR